ncbi:MAG: hypothetical protein ACM3ZQ_09375 [Bacillota bacterium]
MLFSVDSLHCITSLPHEAEYRTYRSRLSAPELTAITDELNRLIDGDEVHTSSWIPGSEWEGTVWQPIYDKACLCNQTAAGMFFGLILFKLMMDRSEWWGFGRYEKNGVPIEGITYFRLTNPPSCVTTRRCPKRMVCPH